MVALAIRLTWTDLTVILNAQFLAKWEVRFAIAQGGSRLRVQFGCRRLQFIPGLGSVDKGSLALNFGAVVLALYFGGAGALQWPLEVSFALTGSSNGPPLSGMPVRGR